MITLGRRGCAELSTPALQPAVERKAVEDQRQRTREARAQKLEADPAELESRARVKPMRGGGSATAASARCARILVTARSVSWRPSEHFHQAGARADRRRKPLPRTRRPLRRVLHRCHGRGADPEADRESSTSTPKPSRCGMSSETAQSFSPSSVAEGGRMFQQSGNSLDGHGARRVPVILPELRPMVWRPTAAGSPRPT